MTVDIGEICFGGNWKSTEKTLEKGVGCDWSGGIAKYYLPAPLSND
jgi:hypothetical protein